MVKGVIEMPDGPKITVEGTPEEIAKVKDLLVDDKVKASRTIRTGRRGKKKGPIGLILELKDGNFFNKPRAIGEIRSKLEEKAYFYPSSSLSPALIRLAKRGELGRLKKEGEWRWVRR